MRSQLTALAVTIEDRIAALERRVAAGVPDDLRMQADYFESHVAVVIRKALAVLLSTLADAGADADADGVLIRSYRDIADLIRGAENALAPALERFSDADQRCTALLGELLRDAGFDAWRPTVLTFSSSNFWVFDGWRVIGAPAGEDRRLLRLPDIAHEFGHCLVVAHDEKLTGELDLDMGVWSKAASVREPGRAVFFESVVKQWSDTWRIELTCDAIGTYLTGPSYGHQHLALCTTSPSDLYGHTHSHPADQARAHVIERTLREIDLDAEADVFRDRWRAFECGLLKPAPGERASAMVKPPDYDDHYPSIDGDTTFVDRVAQLTATGCTGLRIAPYARDADPELSLRALVGLAWERFREDPAGYDAWEREQLTHVYRRLGIAGFPPSEPEPGGAVARVDAVVRAADGRRDA